MLNFNIDVLLKAMSQLGAAIYRGVAYHQRLYRPCLEAIETKGTI